MILEMKNLPKKGRLLKQRTITQKYFNPENVDILKEEEAEYYACLFKKQSCKSERGDYEEVFNQMHHKGIRTL